MDAHHVHQAGAGFRFGMRGGAAPGEIVRGPRVHRGQNGQFDRQAVADHRQENSSGVSLHRCGS